MTSQLASGASRARRSPGAVGGSGMVLPTVVIISKRRMTRPSAIVPSTEPPSESNTSTAPRTSFFCANASNSRGVSLVR